MRRGCRQPREGGQRLQGCLGAQARRLRRRGQQRDALELPRTRAGRVGGGNALERAGSLCQAGFQRVRVSGSARGAHSPEKALCHPTAPELPGPPRCHRQQTSTTGPRRWPGRPLLGQPGLPETETPWARPSSLPGLWGEEGPEGHPPRTQETLRELVI